MDQNKANAILADMKIVLAAIEKKHGVTVIYRGGKYDAGNGGSMTPKISFQEAAITAPEGLGAHAFTPEYKTLERFYPELAGKTFTVPTRGKITLVGYANRARKFPILYKGSDGRTYKGPMSILTACTKDTMVAA